MAEIEPMDSDLEIKHISELVQVWSNQLKDLYKKAKLLETKYRAEASSINELGSGISLVYETIQIHNASKSENVIKV